MARKTISVYRRGDVWVAKKPENTNPSAVRDNQKAAYLAAKSIALKEGRTITVYYSSGQKKVITPKKNDDDSCFLTTACVQYFNLKDDCKELTILRRFRDTHLKSNPELRHLVDLYYLVAPEIVTSINANPNKISIYKDLYTKIKYACHLIESNKNLEAVEFYCAIVQEYLEIY